MRKNSQKLSEVFSTKRLLGTMSNCSGPIGAYAGEAV